MHTNKIMITINDLGVFHGVSYPITGLHIKNMKSIAEFYEKSQIDEAIGHCFTFKDNIFGVFIGTRGHELDKNEFCFVFNSEELGELTIKVFNNKTSYVHVLSGEKKNHLNDSLHEILIICDIHF